MSPRELRVHRNQELFREVNDRILEISTRWGGTLQIVCECADTGCASQLQLTAEQYERIRSHSGRFLIEPGHRVSDGEVIVEEQDGYQVIEINGDSGMGQQAV